LARARAGSILLGGGGGGTGGVAKMGTRTIGGGVDGSGGADGGVACAALSRRPANVEIIVFPREKSALP
jgi:hypothetical protein